MKDISFVLFFGEKNSLNIQTSCYNMLYILDQNPEEDLSADMFRTSTLLRY